MKLSEKYKRSAALDMLAFLARYPNRWHSFSKDKITPQIVGYLETVFTLRGMFEVNRETDQMRLTVEV